MGVQTAPVGAGRKLHESRSALMAAQLELKRDALAPGPDAAGRAHQGPAHEPETPGQGDLAARLGERGWPEDEGAEAAPWRLFGVCVHVGHVLQAFAAAGPGAGHSYVDPPAAVHQGTQRLDRRPGDRHLVDHRVLGGADGELHRRLAAAVGEEGAVSVDHRRGGISLAAAGQAQGHEAGRAVACAGVTECKHDAVAVAPATLLGHGLGVPDRDRHVQMLPIESEGGLRGELLGVWRGGSRHGDGSQRHGVMQGPLVEVAVERGWFGALGG